MVRSHKGKSEVKKRLEYAAHIFRGSSTWNAVQFCRKSSCRLKVSCGCESLLTASDWEISGISIVKGISHPCRPQVFPCWSLFSCQPEKIRRVMAGNQIFSECIDGFMMQYFVLTVLLFKLLFAFSCCPVVALFDLRLGVKYRTDWWTSGRTHIYSKATSSAQDIEIEISSKFFRANATAFSRLCQLSRATFG